MNEIIAKDRLYENDLLMALGVKYIFIFLFVYFTYDG